MRKQKSNQFVLLTNANIKNVQSILKFTIKWLEDNGMTTEEKLSGIKCALCEAITNVIDHAYNEEFNANTLQVDAVVYCDGTVKIAVRDEGKGIEDIEQAKTSLFTTGSSEDHSGMGFTIMETFVGTVKIRSKPGKGTSVLLFDTLN